MAVVVSFIGKVDFKDVQKAEKELAKFRGSTDQTGSKLGDLGKKALAAGAGFAAGVVGVQALTSAFRDSIAEANEAIKVTAATAQIIKSTGGAANVTADQVAALSERLSNQIAVDDELIQSSANLILTFKNVANAGSGLNAVFDRAVLASQDLAAAGFGDAESAAKMLGKALNDPLLGMTALSRAGVTFTAEQKEQIKTLVANGQTLEAQKFILAEVESQVGGVAAATATATDRFDVMMANLKEDVGLALMPFIEALVSGLAPILKNVSSGIQGFSSFLQSNAGALKVAAVAIGAFTTALVLQRVALVTNIATLGVYQAAVLALVKGIDLASAAAARLSLALRAIPLAALAAAIVTFVYALEDGATEMEDFRRRTYAARREIDNMRDSAGNYTSAARYLIATNRYAHLGQKDVAASAARAAAAIDAVRGAIQQYVPWAASAVNATYNLAGASNAAADRYTGLAKSLGAEIGWGARGLQRYNVYLESLNENGTKAAGGTKKLKDELATIGETLPEVIELTKKYGIEFNADAKLANAPKLLERLKGAWKNVSEAVAKAQADFDDTQKSVTDTFRGFLSLADAADSYYARQKAASDALAELTKYRAQLTDEATDQEKTKLKELQDAYQTAQTAAANGAQSIVEEFVQQSEKFGQFGEKLQKLLKAGLNKTSFMQILQMGAERGGDVADSYLNGNTQELVNRTNETVAAYDQLAQDIGKETANTFYAAGLASAIALLKAFAAAFARDGETRKQLKAIIKDLENELQINIKTNVSTPSGVTSYTPPPAAAPSTPAPTVVPGAIAASIGLAPSTVAEIKATTSQPPPSGEGRIWAEIRALAEGGIVRTPTLSLIGEAGPEAVIPLSQLGSMGGGITVNVNAGMGADGAEIGRQVVDALRQYQRRNGPVPITVA